MNEEDFNAVLRAIQRELQLAGVPEIGFVENYRLEGDGRIRSRDLAVQMLKSLELYLATLDRATYDVSMKKIKAMLPRRGRRPADAVIEISEEVIIDGSTPASIPLSQLPNLSRLRKSLRKLAADLSETPYDRPPRVPQ